MKPSEKAIKSAIDSLPSYRRYNEDFVNHLCIALEAAYAIDVVPLQRQISKLQSDNILLREKLSEIERENKWLESGCSMELKKK